MDKKKLALILGSGFSREAGLPTTKKIVEDFLKTPPPQNDTHQSQTLESTITTLLSEFWEDVFGYRGGRFKPTLEDHFTVLDLAANSGHHLGPKYNPKKLRAIRRWSIHRIFRILDQKYESSPVIKTLIKKITKKYDLSVINLNWDIVVEKHLNALQENYDYVVEVHNFNGRLWNHSGTQLFKMHGSANWVYCDSCRRIYADKDQKSVLYRKVFLEAIDFKLFGYNNIVVSNDDRRCQNCDNILAGRVATFSYRKAFSIAQFQTIWDRAHSILGEAERWLFIGYSLPAADFEFMHLLKSAQLGRGPHQSWSATAIISRNRNTKGNYKRFFGKDQINIQNCGLKNWVNEGLDSYINNEEQILQAIPQELPPTRE